MGEKIIKLKINLPESAYKFVQERANRMGVDPGAFVYRTIGAMMEASDQAAASQQVVDKAFALTEDPDPSQMTPAGVIPPPPAPMAAQPAPAKAPEAKLAISAPPPPRATPPHTFSVDTHPCVRLIRQYPPPWTPRDIQGMCTSPKQHGRPCTWNQGVASGCDCYEPRTRAGSNGKPAGRT
jgi:hypothetical protein